MYENFNFANVLVLQYTLRGYILGSGAPGTPVVMRQLQVHFVTITVESFKLYCQKYHNLS